MLFRLNLEQALIVKDFYKIQRNTVWSQADQNNILVAVASGECVFTIENQDFLVGRGDLFFIPANQLYRRRPKDSVLCEFYYIHFTLPMPAEMIGEEQLQETISKLREGIYDSLTQNTYQTSIVSTDVYLSYQNDCKKCIEEIFYLLEKALAEVYRYDVESSMILSLCVSLILSLATRSNLNQVLSESKTAIDSAYPVKIKKALLFIRQNYTRKITLDELCSCCSVTPQHLSRMFRQEFGISPIQYINQLKISYSKELMRTTSLSIKEIAYNLGFDYPHYFSHLFYKLEGIYPTDFKKKFDAYKDKPLLP